MLSAVTASSTRLALPTAGLSGSVVSCAGPVVSSWAWSTRLSEATLPAASMTVAVTWSVPPSAGLAKVVVAKPLVMSPADRVTILTRVPSVKTRMSPATTLVLSKLPLTVKVVALPSSVGLTNPSLLLSVVISTVGAASPLGALVSSLALSAALLAVALPRLSCSLAVTLRVPPSAGLAKVVVAKPLPMSAPLRVTVWVVVPSVKISLSPAMTLVLSKLPLTVKVVALPISVALTKPSLSASVVISTVGATPPLGAELLMSALSVASGVGLVLPALSLMLALTLKVVPSPVGVRSLTITLPSVMCCAVRVMVRGLLPLALRVTVSPAAAWPGKVMVALNWLVSSAPLMKPSLLPSVSRVTLRPVLLLSVGSTKLLVSSTALSVPAALVLLALLVRVAVTLKVPPLAGAVKLSVTNPLSRSAWTSTWVLVVVPSVTVMVSPTAAPLGSVVLTLTVVALPSSALLMKPSLLPSVAMTTVGAPTGVVLMVAKSVATLLVLPEASVTVAVTSSLLPLAGVLKVTLRLPVLTCDALRVMLCAVLPVPVMTRTSPALASVGSVTRTMAVVPPLSSVVLRMLSLLPSVVIWIATPCLVDGLTGLRLDRSRLAVSLATGDVLPNVSAMVALTLNVPPSPGLVKLVLTLPAVMAAASSVTVLTAPPVAVSVKVMTSPTATLVLSKLAVTLMTVLAVPLVLPISAKLIRPSLLASVSMVRASALPSLGAVVLAV